MAFVPTLLCLSLLLQLAFASCPLDPPEPSASPPEPSTSPTPAPSPPPAPSLPPTPSPPPTSLPHFTPSTPPVSSLPVASSPVSSPPVPSLPAPSPPAPSPPRNPYYKVIYDKGHVLTTAYSDHYKFLDVEYVNDFFMFKFAHKPHWPHDDYMIIQRNDKPWSEISFVIENMPGHDCEDGAEPLRPFIYRCVGDMMVRDLNDDEKAKIAKSKNVLAAITDPDTKLAYKVTYVEARLMIEQSGEMKQIKVEDNYDPGSTKVHAVVEPGKEAYGLLHDAQPFAKERFVVESTADPKTDCTKPALDRLLCYCSGNLRLRELTSDEAASFAL